MVKNKQATQDKLIKAVGEVLADVGFSGVGVNAVAKRAGVDKVLIYRYFGSFDKLCLAFAQSADFWPSLKELIPDPEVLSAMGTAERVTLVLKRFTTSLRKRPLTLEVMAWELLERNAFTIELENVREASGLELNRFMQDLSSNTTRDSTDEIDWLAITTVLSAGMQYLALRARKINVYNGIELNKDEGWMQLERSIETLIAGVTT
ncbi:MAG: TetR/AcrR family transcriptional regulator [Arenicella sp.]|jgi:AcrR family transcriptional regulator|nr:TetR/AcrR family transcriptional regulator [Arenicella sp.]